MKTVNRQRWEKSWGNILFFYAFWINLSEKKKQDSLTDTDVILLSGLLRLGLRLLKTVSSDDILNFLLEYH